MRVHVADHPLITHKLTMLRDKTTPSPTFRALVEELVTLLAYEATRNVRVERVTVETPVSTAEGLAISQPRPLVVPILRAGLGMLEGMVKLVPTAEVGFLGMVRDETTLQPAIYAERLPDDLSKLIVIERQQSLVRVHDLNRERVLVLAHTTRAASVAPVETPASVPALLRD